MKLRSIICASAVAAAMAASATTTVTGANTFARLPVTSNFKNSIIAIPLSGCGESGTQIYVTNLVQTTGLTTGDTLMYKDGENWYAWEINASGNWQALTTTTEVGGMSITPAANATALACGKACWLIRSSTSNPIYLYGQVNETLPASVTVSGADAAGKIAYTLIAKPSESSALDLLDWHPSEAAAGDVLLVPAANGSTGQITYKYSGSAWQTATTSVTEMTNPRTGKTTYVTNSTWTAISASTPIPAGKGFMYGRKGTSGATLAW